MNFLYVILGILALITLLLVSYLRVQLLYTNKTCTLHICIGPIRYKVPMQKKMQYRKLAKKLRKKKLSSKEAVSAAKNETKSPPGGGKEFFHACAGYPDVAGRGRGSGSFQRP